MNRIVYPVALSIVTAFMLIGCGGGGSDGGGSVVTPRRIVVERQNTR